MKKRQKDILQALKDLGGMASVRDIAAKANLHVNGVSQSLGALQALGKVKCADTIRAGGADRLYVLMEYP